MKKGFDTVGKKQMLKKKKLNENIRKKSLLNEIKKTSKSLIYTDIWFNCETDQDLIDSCIYQREALNARYSTLIMQAKNNNISLPPFKN